MAFLSKEMIRPGARPMQVQRPVTSLSPTPQPNTTTMGGPRSPQGTGDSRYQLALDYAERQRNYVGGIRDAHAGQAYHGPDAVASMNDTSQIKVPTDMPDAYGLLGTTRGAQHELFNDEGSAQGFLARARQFDPNAHIVYGQQNGGGGEGGQGINEYYIDWDNSKAPQSNVIPQGTPATNFGGYGNQDLFNRNMSVVDPHYGVLTDPRNIDQRRAQDDGWMRYAGMIPAAIATVMSGGAASPALIAAINSIPQLGQALSSGHVPWSQIVSMAAQYFGVPSYVTGAANAAYQYSQQPKG